MIYLTSSFCTKQAGSSAFMVPSFLSRKPCNENATKYYTYNSLRLLVFENNAGGISSKWLLLMSLEVGKNWHRIQKYQHKNRKQSFKCIQRSMLTMTLVDITGNMII